MNKTIVQQVVGWFANNCEQLSESFPIAGFRLTHASDAVHGKVVVELDGESAAAMITFWNKGDVQAMLLETVSKKEHTLDDRVLTSKGNIPALLGSYVQRFGGLDRSLAHP